MADEAAAALAALDRALARRPERDGDAFAEATEHLCRLRDRLTAEKHIDLGAINAIISAVLAGHFPLGETPWPLVQTAADHLRTLAASQAEANAFQNPSG